MLDALAEIELQEREWEVALARIGAPLLRLSYEQLADDYGRTVRTAFDFLAIPPSTPLTEPRLKPQADGLTEEWLARAREDLPGVRF